MTPIRFYAGQVLADSSDHTLHSASADGVVRSVTICNPLYFGAFQVRLKIVDPTSSTVRWLLPMTLEVLPTDVVVENVSIPIPSGYNLICTVFHPDPTQSVEVCVGGMTT